MLPSVNIVLELGIDSLSKQLLWFDGKKREREKEEKCMLICNRTLQPFSWFPLLQMKKLCSRIVRSSYLCRMVDHLNSSIYLWHGFNSWPTEVENWQNIQWFSFFWICLYIYLEELYLKNLYKKLEVYQ